MPTPSRNLNPKPHRRRALTLVAGCDSAGCTEGIMLAHGFTADQLAEFVRMGFAAKATERGGAGDQTFEVASFKITEAGQRALGRDIP
jgi:hypothetical protein